MGFDQYHEPVGELTQETRSFARMIVSLGEEAEAINWYTQRLSVEQDAEARSILTAAMQEEYLHFSMDLEWLSRRTPAWRAALKEILFTEGDIVEAAEQAEEIIEHLGEESGTASPR